MTAGNIKMEWISLTLCLLCFIQLTSGGFYLMADYYMDQDHNRAFGGVCRQTVRDACAYVNSHVNNLQLANYAGSRDCWMTLDAGKMKGARYRLEFDLWDLEPADAKKKCTKDYVEFYDGPAVNKSTSYGRFCGPDPPKFVGFPTQRAITIRFQTDDAGFYKGYQIKAVRTEPLPCQDDEYHCQEDEKCIDLRLKCDGTNQCTDAQDEEQCDTLDKFVSFFLSRGLVGLIGIGCAIFLSCIIMWVLISCCCRSKIKKQPRRGRR